MGKYKLRILNYKWLILICLFFLATRLYQINTNPPSLYWDEASSAYNAYSILATGHDEWGKFLPLHIRAFGEFKLPVYLYTVSGFEAFLGLSELAERLPAVIYALGCLLLLYGLAKKVTIFETTALLSVLFFATVPWYFIFSRTGFEANAGLFFYLLGIWFFLKYKRKYFLFAVFSFLLSMYSYNSFRVLVPLTFLIFMVGLIAQKELAKKYFKTLALALLIFILGCLPIVGFARTGGLTRFDQVSIFRDHPPAINAAETFIQNYIQHFSPQFLVWPHDQSSRSLVPGFSQLTPLMFLLLLPGFYRLYQKHSKILLLYLLLIIIAPIPAALTFESPHALRSLTMVPFLSIVAALGVEQLTFRKWVPALLAVIIIGFFGWYFYKFIATYSQTEAVDWQYPYKLINTQYLSQISGASNVYISPKLAQPYVFTLFYQKYDPLKFRREVEYNPPDQWGFSLVKSFGKYHFEDVKEGQKVPSNSLIFGFGDDKTNPGQMIIETK